MTAVLLPGVLLAIPASVLMGRYSVRVTGGLALVLVSISGLVSATATSFVGLLLGRLLLGIGGAFILTLTPTLVTQWFPREELGKAMGIFTVNMPLAVIVAFPSGGALSVAYGWRAAFWVSLAVGVVTTVLYFTLAVEGPLLEQSGKGDALRGFRNLNVWKVGIVWMFFAASVQSFMTWGPTLLVGFRGLGSVEASFYTSLVSWMSLVFVPIWGFLSDRMGQRRVLILAGSVLLALMLGAVSQTYGVALVASIVLLGATSAMVPPLVQSLPSELLGPSLASAGFAILTITGNVGAALTQPAIGGLIDSTGSYSFVILSMAALALLGAITAVTVKSR